MAAPAPKTRQIQDGEKEYIRDLLIQRYPYLTTKSREFKKKFDRLWAEIRSNPGTNKKTEIYMVKYNQTVAELKAQVFIHFMSYESVVTDSTFDCFVCLDDVESDAVDLLTDEEKAFYDDIQSIVDWRSHSSDYMVVLSDGTRQWVQLPDDDEKVKAYMLTLKAEEREHKQDPDVLPVAIEQLNEWVQCPHILDEGQDDPVNDMEMGNWQRNPDSEDDDEDDDVIILGDDDLETIDEELAVIESFLADQDEMDQVSDEKDDEKE